MPAQSQRSRKDIEPTQSISSSKAKNAETGQQYRLRRRHIRTATERYNGSGRHLLTPTANTDKVMSVPRPGQSGGTKLRPMRP